MSLRLARLASLSIGTLMIAAPIHAESLDRLFMTPERRAALDRQRQMNIQEVRTVQGATLTLDGVVSRSSGRNTIWINGQPQTESTLDTGINASVSQGKPERVLLTPGDTGSTPVKVGETLTRGTGERTDVLRDGHVSVGTAR